MIQRIQSVYLILASLISGGLIFVFPLWKNMNGELMTVVNSFNQNEIIFKGIFIGFILSAIFSLVSLFMYSNRKLQVALNRFNIVINFLLLVVIVYLLLTLSGEAQVSEKGIGCFLPILCILFLSLANKAIMKDEKLVKSVDRLR